MRLHLWSASVIALAAGAIGGSLKAQDQANQHSGLSAREVFYEVDQATTVTPGNATASAPGGKTPVKNKVRPPSKPAAVASNIPRPSATRQAAAGAESPIPASGEHGPGDDQAQVTLASLSDKRYQPLGMRYAVYRLTNDQQRTPVDVSTVFHSNDHIQFSVEVNTPGYLYVVSRGASGKWSTLFPGSGDSTASAEIRPHQTYTMPPGSQITFAEPAGKEELFLFLSRQPVRSTEDLMLEMSSSGEPGPVSQPENPPNQHFQQDSTMEAFNRMDDAKIAGLNRFYSRDLIVEKVNDSSAASKPVPQAPEKDNSVYVVDPSGKPNSHVVADIVFRHE